MFIRVHLRLKMPDYPKMAGFGAENRDFGPETARKRRFQAFFTLFHLRGPLRLVSVDRFSSAAYARTGKAHLRA